jgi:orotate phosphoribosyltransferase
MIPFAMTTLPTFEDLARLIADASLLRGEFTLRSGRTSHYYLDKYRFSTKPEILHPLAEMFRERIPEGTQRLAGAELGGIPLVAAASLATGLPSLFVRGEGELKAGESVVFLEDVATTGGQALEAVEVLQKAGAKVSGVISVINREEGARENIEAAGLKFESLFSVADLGVVDP